MLPECDACENVRYRYLEGLFIPYCPLKEGDYLDSVYSECPYGGVKE